MNKKKNSLRVLIPVAALFLCAVVILLERYGITYDQTQQLIMEDLNFTEDITVENTCLILTADDEYSVIFEEMMKDVLSGMKVGYESMLVTENFDASVLDNYQTAVITFEDWSVFGKQLKNVFNWVKSGGHLMNTITPAADGSFGTISSRLGILSIDDEHPEIFGFRMKNNCMAGAPEDREFFYALEEGEGGLQTSLGLELDDSCEIYMVSTSEEVPLIWARNYGDGRVAIINEAISDKYQRGFLCLMYSLLEEVCIYPVINASAFYLDDFPSPVPSGNSDYIFRDYGVDTASFYSSVWWPEVLKWEEEYGILHTGLIIEEYSDTVKAPFSRNQASSQFLRYGNMLLNNGGELGFHGYNHMPLCQKGIDEPLKYGSYKLWNSFGDMHASLSELQTFSEELFPQNKFQVYVPPSNIISESGIQALLSGCPDVRILASTYLRDADGIAYEQEFEAGNDGLIHTPRITSGCAPDEYQYMTALSELNFHYVQSHFMHPDDVLDEDRGAAKGWAYLSGQFENYLDWIYTSVPDIRNVTGSQMGNAVLQYDRLTVQRSLENNVLTVKLGGFSGEAHFLLRINAGDIESAEGCDYEKVTGNLYAVHAVADELKIRLGETE